MTHFLGASLLIKPAHKLSQLIIDRDKDWSIRIKPLIHDPAWALPGFNYRKSVGINGSVMGSQTDYQMLLTVHFGSGTSISNQVYLDGKCNGDFSDIRFINNTGIPLNYYISEIFNSDYAVVWVKVDTIPASPNSVIIWLYYGNSSAISESDSINTFIFYDDFSADLNKWDAVPANWEIDTGRLKANSADQIITTIQDHSNLLFQVTVSTVTDSGFRRVKVLSPDLSEYDSAWLNFTNNQVQLIKTGEVLGGVVSLTLSANINYKVGIKKTGEDWYLYINDVLKQTKLAWSNLAPGKIALASEGTQVTYFDEVVIRNYVDSEPVFESWSDTESYSIRYQMTDLNFLVSGMVKGDLLYFSGSKLDKLAPGSIGTQLSSKGINADPVWVYPP